MALISCPECGKQISSKAAACPDCACPAADPQSIRLVSGEEIQISEIVET